MMTKYELYYDVMSALSDRYIELFPTDELGNALMPITDLFTCHFETALIQTTPHVNYDNTYTLYSYYAYVDINTDGVSIFPFAVNDNWYQSSSALDSANSVFSSHNNNITVTPNNTPCFMLVDSNGYGYLSALDGLRKMSTVVEYFADSDSPVLRNCYISVVNPSNIPTSLSSSSGDLQLSPLIDRNMFVVTNDQNFYNRFKSYLSNSNSSTSDGVAYTSGDNGICIYTTSPKSFNTILHVVNTDLVDNPLPDFPQFKHKETGEYYIGSANEFDFDLSLPDVTLQTPDFSLLGSATSYLVDTFSELSLTIPLIFCIILTVIIKNVKG